MSLHNQQSTISIKMKMKVKVKMKMKIKVKMIVTMKVIICVSRAYLGVTMFSLTMARTAAFCLFLLGLAR